MEFTIESWVRGHHVSGEFWTPNVEEELSCQRKEDSTNDQYAVTVKTGAHTEETSVACSRFLHRIGTIVFEITGSR